MCIPLPPNNFQLKLGWNGGGGRCIKVFSGSLTETALNHTQTIQTIAPWKLFKLWISVGGTKHFWRSITIGCRKPHCATGGGWRKCPRLNLSILPTSLDPGSRETEMEQDPMSLPPPYPMSSACLLSVGNFRQRIRLFRALTDAGTKEIVLGD